MEQKQNQQQNQEQNRQQTQTHNQQQTPKQIQQQSQKQIQQQPQKQNQQQTQKQYQQQTQKQNQQQNQLQKQKQNQKQNVKQNNKNKKNQNQQKPNLNQQQKSNQNQQQTLDQNQNQQQNQDQFQKQQQDPDQFQKQHQDSDQIQQKTQNEDQDLNQNQQKNEVPKQQPNQNTQRKQNQEQNQQQKQNQKLKPNQNKNNNQQPQLQQNQNRQQKQNQPQKQNQQKNQQQRQNQQPNQQQRKNQQPNQQQKQNQQPNQQQSQNQQQNQIQNQQQNQNQTQNQQQNQNQAENQQQFLIKKQQQNQNQQQNQIQKTRVNIGDYEILETIVIYEDYGKLKLVRNKQTGEYFAMKIFKKLEFFKSSGEVFCDNSRFVKSIKSEYILSRTLNNNFLVKMLGFDQDERNFYILQEYIPGGDLSTHILKQLDNNAAVFYAAQVVLFLEQMHSKRFIYRSLFPKNLLIGYDGYLRINCLYFVKFLEKKRTYSMAGFIEQCAPEMLQNEGHSYSSDWWQLGLLIYEMLSSKIPFKQGKEEEYFDYLNRIVNAQYKMRQCFSDDAKNLIYRLLQPKPWNRIGNLKGGVNDIKNHIWFKNIDWKKLEQKSMHPPFIPNNDLGDPFHYSKYKESQEIQLSYRPEKDPFSIWDQ
ncbi:unnamed protein product [Paramecium octaurelia]|uniref:cAMP-dependent protein kinase n=1 Tax=Paramecium octaurelia TaxID=43137 RepID=A0A8S1SK59_PAROT|nr:unnamed protein product [Paramecium octaurelia]